MSNGTVELIDDVIDKSVDVNQGDQIHLTPDLVTNFMPYPTGVVHRKVGEEFRAICMCPPGRCQRNANWFYFTNASIGPRVGDDIKTQLPNNLGELFIAKVRPGDSGYYYCLETQTDDRTDITPLKLIVHGECSRAL